MYAIVLYYDQNKNSTLQWWLLSLSFLQAILARQNINSTVHTTVRMQYCPLWFGQPVTNFTTISSYINNGSSFYKDKTSQVCSCVYFSRTITTTKSIRALQRHAFANVININVVSQTNKYSCFFANVINVNVVSQTNNYSLYLR